MAELDPISERAAQALAKDPTFQRECAKLTADRLWGVLKDDMTFRGATAQRLAESLRNTLKETILAEVRPAVAAILSKELGTRVAELGRRMADRLLADEAREPEVRRG